MKGSARQTKPENLSLLWTSAWHAEGMRGGLSAPLAGGGLRLCRGQVQPREVGGPLPDTFPDEPIRHVGSMLRGARSIAQERLCQGVGSGPRAVAEDEPTCFPVLLHWLPLCLGVLCLDAQAVRSWYGRVFVQSYAAQE